MRLAVHIANEGPVADVVVFEVGTVFVGGADALFHVQFVEGQLGVYAGPVFAGISGTGITVVA